MVPTTLVISEQQFSEIVSACDPSTARLGEAFLDPEISQHFDEEMITLLKDARQAWV